MPDIKGNNKQIFDYLSSQGATGIGENADQFQKYMEKDDNRRQIYDYLSSVNAQGIGNSYDEFTAFVYGGDQQAEQAGPSRDEIRKNAAEGWDMFNKMRESRKPATSPIPQAEEPLDEKSELQRKLEERMANETRQKIEARDARRAAVEEGADEFYRMRRKMSGTVPISEAPEEVLDQMANQPEKKPAETLEELQRQRETVKDDSDFVKEYEAKKAEYEKNLRDMASVKGDTRGMDFSRYNADKEWLEKNEYKYQVSKQRVDDVEYGGMDLQAKAKDEIAEAIRANKEAMPDVSPVTARGSDPFGGNFSEMRSEEGMETMYRESAGKILDMAERTMNQGSKYDEGYKGDELERLWTAARQYVQGGVNNFDLADVTSLGLTEGKALYDARRVGEHYNKIITDTIKDLGYSDGEIERMMSDMDKQAKQLEPIAVELDRQAAEIKEMEETINNMINGGESKEKLDSYLRQYDKKVEEYNRKYKSEYEPVYSKYKANKDKYDEAAAAIEAALNAGLTGGEEAVLDAVEKFTYAKELRKDDVSKASAAGAGFEQTLEFMLDFILTGGIAKAGTKAAAKLTRRHLERKLGKEGFAKLAAQQVIKPTMWSKAATDLGVAVARTGVMAPRNLATWGEQIAEYSGKDELGRYQFDRSKINAFFNTGFQSLVEYWSEGFGEYFSAAEQAAFRKVMGRAPKEAIGKTLKGLRGSVGQYLDYGKFDGMLNEMLEEVVGSSFNSLAGWLSSKVDPDGPGIGDKEALSQFFAGENLATTILSFLPLSAISSATNLSAYHKMKTRYDEGVKMLEGFVDAGYLERSELESLTANMSEMTPEQISGNIEKIANKVYEKNNGALPDPKNFAKNMIGFVEGSFAMDLRHDEWEESQEKMDVVGAYAEAYSNPNVYGAYDADQAEADAKAAALSAGFSEEELEDDSFMLAQEAASMRETDPERSMALHDYAVAKASANGLKNGFMNGVDRDAEEYENSVRENLDRDGIVVMANMNEDGQQVPVFVISNDATIGPDGKITTPSGPDGLVTIRRGEDSELETVKASELSGADVQMTDVFVTENVDAIKRNANEFYETARKTVSPTGQSRAISQRVGTNVVVRGNGAYQPVRVERMTDDGMKVVISGDKDALQGVATAAQVQTPGGKYLEIDVTRLWPLLSREADGSLTTFEEETNPVAGTAQAQPRQAPAQAPQVNPDELQDSTRTIMFNGRPTKVTVNSVGGDGVWFTYMDETGTEREGDMPLEDFMNAIVADEAPAAAEEAAGAPATAQGQAFPVDEKGNRIYDHPSVSPQRAYGELMHGSVVGSKDEANRMKYIASKANKAAQAVADAENKIAGIQAKKDAVDEWEIGEDEELDAFENRKDAKKAEYDAEIAKVQDQMAELKRKAAHWAAVRDMAKAVAYMRKDARLVARADAWTQRTGIKVKICRTIDEVDDATAKRELKKGERVMGWYNEDTGEVGLYLPNLPNESEVDKTFIHEVIAHRGLRELLDKDGKTGNYDALCDKVWDQLMSEEDRKKYLAYNSHLKGDEQFLRRAAADEWIARYSETLGLEENKNLFDKFVDFVKEFLDRILGEDAKISKDDIAMLLRSSLARYESERKADTRAQLYREGIAAETQAAQLDDNAIRFNIKTEESVEQKIRDFAKSKEGQKLGWTDEQIESIIGETADLMRAIHAAVSGDKYYDEWAEKVPTVNVDWRDGVEKPTVTWSRANIEYKYDMSADLLCINNEGLETVLASPTMVELMLKMNQTTKEGFTSDDYLRLYETLRDMGFVVPCKGCFDAAMRLKMLPSVARKFVELVNKTIDERNENPEAFDRKVRSMAKPGSDTTVEGFPAATGNKADAIRVGVAGDRLTEHISWAQLMSAEGQTKALADWGGIFRAWQKTGAGRPKDKLLPEPWSGDIVNSTTTIIGKFGEKTPSYRDIEVNQGTGLRRNSHSEFRPLLAIDEIQFMREAFIRGLTVFKYMKELDDVRLFGKLGVKFNMSFFPAFVEGAPAAGLDANGNYIAAEESVGGREYEYVGEDGKTHYDGMKGWQEAQKYINKDVSLSSVIFSIPHLIKAFTDVPTKSNPVGMWGSLIPFHASGATAGSLKKQGLGDARALGVGHGFEEAMTDYDKGVTNFEAVQNDRFGEGWEILEGTKAGTKVTPGHKLEFANGTHYYNAGLGLHLFKSTYIFDSEIDEHPGEFVGVKAYAEKYGHPYSIDYNDKVREIGTDTAYQDASDYYVDMLRNLGLVPRFDFEVPEATFLQMCAAANVDPNHPKLGWKGEGHSWSPVDSEAYYSLWCDYGMIDPETGKLAPHNPVGIVDAVGNRTFQLPENTVDIIKDGVARYSERKDREAARELDAIEEFARRSVAEGKLTQEDADSIIFQARAEQETPDVAADGSWTHFRKLEDPAKIEELENGEWEEDAYRAVQFIPDPNGEWEYDLGDGNGVQKGNVYPPMSAQTEKGEWRNPIQKGVIEESEEAPGKAFLKNGKWVFRLHKGNGKYVDAAYNPYIHSSDTMLNDQFSEAQSRGNLVVMRVAVPKSELDGENLYQAEKAKDHVGRHDWKAGPIQGELTGTRTVYLSRYDKPMELMPIEKVGESVAKMLEGQVETMPTNVVWPQLRAELEKRGMEFVETDNKGKLVSGENAGKTWKQVYGKKKPAKKKSTKKQKNSDTGTRFRKANESQLGLVSNAGAALDRIKMEKATPEQWVKMLEKEGGLKAGEDKWLGLSDWLKGLDRKTVTKDEIDDYIAEHRIQIEEVKYSESGENDRDAMEQKHPGFWNAYSIDTNWRGETGVDQIQDVAIAVDLYNRDHEDKIVPYDTGRDGRPVLTEEDYDKLMDYGDEMLNELRHINPTRLNYTTEGLDNNREIALTVPTIEPWNQGDDIHFGDAGNGRAVAWIRFGETIAPNKEGEKIVHDHVAAVDASESFEDSMKEKYGAEWEDKLSDEEKAERDRLQKEADAAFAKTMDYRDDKVLVIDEIQSKRHQEGREKGYVSADLDRLQKELDALRDEYNEYTESIEKKYGQESELDKVATPEELQKAKDYHAREKELRGRVVEEKRKGSIPVAPFEKNWHELAMKRMLRLAAEEGYDYVAWTTGEQQADRYNLSRLIDEIEVKEVESGDATREVKLYNDGIANFDFGIDNDGNIVTGAHKGETLAGFVGKEMATQIMEMEDGERKSTDQFKIGGEGMKGFYDDILPRFMNKYGKKWGVKVQDIELPYVEDAGRVMHAVPVTQEMKDSVMEGQTMFRKSDEVDVPSVSANLYDAYENQNGEDKPWMSEQELIDRIEAELPYGIDTKELFSKIDEYRRLDDEDFDEGRRDFSGSERDAVFQEILSGLNGLAENGRAETSKEDLEKAERIAAAERIVTEKVLDSMPEAIGAGVMQVSRDKMPAGHKTDKGYYDPATNTVSVCMDNVLDERDAVATVIHETVGRKGLREIFGDQYRESMASSYAALDAEGRAWVNGYMLRNGLQPGDEGILRGMQEYMAVQAERGEGSFLDAVNDILSQAVDLSVGTEGFRFTNRELAYILRASYEHAKNPGWLDTPAGKAQDTLWKREYGINESDPNRPTDPEGPDAGTRFRRGDTGNALRDYERDMKDWRTAAVMENQNADLPVKIGYEKALKEKYGDQWSDRMKNLPENEDYLMRHNLSSSRAETESHNFMLFHFNPMLEKLREVQAKLVGRLSSADERQDAYERILDYLYAVSGLERNEWERNNGGEAKDWSGLTSLMGRPKEEWQEAEDDARAMVDAFKAEVGDDALLDQLWDAVRSCTDYSLDHAYRYGLLAKDEYERLRGTDTKPRMWNFYLPLRGFVERTAEEEYNYAGLVSTDKGNNEVVKDAKGRWTEADNPLANILNIALKEIVQGNENYARQALYRFATNLGENSLLSVRKPWYVKDPATGKWSLAEPEEGQDIEAFEAEMKAKKERKEARQGRKGLDLGLIMASKGHRNQHLIHVKVGGEDRMIWVNGNPALARAVSGIGKEPNYRLFRAGSRVISNLFTTYSIDFTAKNLLRDSIYSRVALLVKEDQHYRWQFMKNWWQNFGFGAFAFPMVRLAAMWDSGALQRKPADKRSKREQMFIDFMTDGGQTGYTVIKSVEKIKSDIERTMRRAGKKTGPVVVPILGWYGLGVRTLNEAFELLTRFTAYQTSRDMGRTGQRAAYDAKEISVNFNRKGAQSNEGFWGQVAAYFGGTHYFYNAGIQGFDNFLRLFTNPRKGKGWIMPVTSAGIMTLGFFTPMINALLSGGGDDDDDNREAEWYWNLPEWVRRNNIVIGFKNKYLAVPLPVEFRALYGLGDLTASVFAANKYAHPTPGRVMLDAVALASSVLPVNPIEGVNGSIASASELAESAVRTAVPDLTMFFVDWVTNKDYTGRALVNKSPYNPAMPASQGAFASTPKALVEACQWIGEKTGVDVAPGLVRDFLNNYGGGYYRFAEDLSKQIFTDDTHPRRWDDVPFLSGFTGHIDEDRTITYSNTVLNTYKDLSTDVVKKMNLYSNSADITEKIAFEDPDALPAKAKVQAILSGKDYELAKMYYFGMKDEDTGQTEKVVKVHQKGKSAGKQYKATVHIKIPGVSTRKKTWRDLRDYWASLPDNTAEEKAAKAQAYADMTNAWHEYYNAAADLADKLMDYDYGKTE